MNNRAGMRRTRQKQTLKNVSFSGGFAYFTDLCTQCRPFCFCKGTSQKFYIYLQLQVIKAVERPAES